MAGVVLVFGIVNMYGQSRHYPGNAPVFDVTSEPSIDITSLTNLTAARELVALEQRLGHPELTTASMSPRVPRSKRPPSKNGTPRIYFLALKPVPLLLSVSATDDAISLRARHSAEPNADFLKSVGPLKPADAAARDFDSGAPATDREPTEGQHLVIVDATVNTDLTDDVSPGGKASEVDAQLPAGPASTPLPAPSPGIIDDAFDNARDGDPKIDVMAADSGDHAETGITQAESTIFTVHDAREPHGAALKLNPAADEVILVMDTSAGDTDGSWQATVSVPPAPAMHHPTPVATSGERPSLRVHTEGNGGGGMTLTAQVILETDALIARGDALLRTNDASSARLYYQLALRRGRLDAALSMGATYDPVFLAEQGIQGVRPEPRQAVKWYLEGESTNVPEASERLRRLLSHLERAARFGDTEARAVLEDIGTISVGP